MTHAESRSGDVTFFLRKNTSNQDKTIVHLYPMHPSTLLKDRGCSWCFVIEYILSNKCKVYIIVKRIVNSKIHPYKLIPCVCSGCESVTYLKAALIDTSNTKMPFVMFGI